MAPVIYRIDPEPDTIIILKNSCASFAEWEPSIIEAESAEAECRRGYGSVPMTKKEKQKHKKGLARSVPTPETEELCPIATEGDVEPSESDASFVAGAQSLTTNGTPDLSFEEEQPPDVPTTPPEPEEEGIHYYVSSRHLMMASPVFRRTLKQDGFTESSRNVDDGLLHIDASDWDEKAFLIILQIFHLRNKPVPRMVTLGMLARIAVLVDYYDCGEALEMFTTLWVANLIRTPLPVTYCRELVLWIWVAWVFDLKSHFERATATAIKLTTEPLRTLDLPIPVRVSDAIESVRYQALDFVIESLYSLLDTYRSTTYICPSSNDASFSCASFLLGALTKEMDTWSLLKPRPEVPFQGLSFHTICEKLGTVKSPSWYPIYNRGHQHNCTLVTAVASIITDAKKMVVGLYVGRVKAGVQARQFEARGRTE